MLCIAQSKTVLRSFSFKGTNEMAGSSKKGKEDTPLHSVPKMLFMPSMVCMILSQFLKEEGPMNWTSGWPKCMQRVCVRECVPLHHMKTFAALVGAWSGHSLS